MLRDRKVVEIKLIIALSSSQSGVISFIQHCSVLWKEFGCREGRKSGTVMCTVPFRERKISSIIIIMLL